MMLSSTLFTLSACSIAPAGHCYPEDPAECDWPPDDSETSVEKAAEEAEKEAEEAECGETPGMACVPAGEFTRGGPGFDWNYPQRKAWISEFEIDVREVSIAEYKQCEAAGVCVAVTQEAPDDRPVEIQWGLAATYCEWRQARLPTEAEWEKAARGALDVRHYPWGDAEPDCDQMNHAPCQDPPALVATGVNPGGESPYGLLHMSGNAGEWVADWTTESGPSQFPYYDYYLTAPYEDPQGPASGDLRAWKGGSYRDTSPLAGHIAMHAHANPLIRAGFRCARSR
ncbi:formylglycine-generating enzyme family protein [Nannocystis punicea]|uniref:SUMF1/EgtB/PvdO family nonheme iron enzyme n=1 Tax=Nannocystis punicea TaxID=2995304 RepID=A0ABY7GSY3_9BACT|nr:SUMF1/EgtB/PvdO family nonheme iron enzyme [Nannocystis poenicansa]WAS89979.1 SUMF1/EgtB/PvdO family nonheme iron enzyme [Nannocystis poenicansa]